MYPFIKVFVQQNSTQPSCSMVNQALRIGLEWSSEAIYFSTHQFELIYHNLFLNK